MKCTKRRTNGEPCTKRAIAGTVSCEDHSGRTLAVHKAKGRLVLTAREYGFSDEELPGVDVDSYMLRLTAGAYRQAKMYERLVAEAYDAAERLRGASGGALGDDDLPAHTDNPTDRERALYDLQRVFREGGVSVLIGAKWGHTVSKDGGDLYEAEEGIRSLVDLWNQERDRAFRFSKECKAAKLDERLVRLAEGQQELVADYVNGVLAALGHDVGDPLVLRVLAEQLPALAGGGS